MHKAGAGGTGSSDADDSEASVARRAAQSEYGGGASRPRRDSGLEITNLSEVLRSSVSDGTGTWKGKAARNRGVSAPPAPGAAVARPRRTSSGSILLDQGLDRRQSTSALQFFDRQKSDCAFSDLKPLDEIEQDEAASKIQAVKRGQQVRASVAAQLEADKPNGKAPPSGAKAT